MALRALELLDFALRKTFDHPSQPAFNKGDEVKFNGDDELLMLCTANDPLSIGIIEVSNIAGHGARVVMGNGVIRVTVGAGGATRGKYAYSAVAGSFTDIPVVNNSATPIFIRGKFLQNGTAGDHVGMRILDAEVLST